MCVTLVIIHISFQFMFLIHDSRFTIYCFLFVFLSFHLYRVKARLIHLLFFLVFLFVNFSFWVFFYLLFFFLPSIPFIHGYCKDVQKVSGFRRVLCERRKFIMSSDQKWISIWNQMRWSLIYFSCIFFLELHSMLVVFGWKQQQHQFFSFV